MILHFNLKISQFLKELWKENILNILHNIVRLWKILIYHYIFNIINFLEYFSIEKKNIGIKKHFIWIKSSTLSCRKLIIYPLHPHTRIFAHPHINSLILRRISTLCYACIQNVPNTVLNFGIKCKNLNSVYSCFCDI